MKIVYQNSFDKRADVFVAEIESFEMDYLIQYGFEFQESLGSIQQQAQRYFVRRLLADQLGIEMSAIKKRDRIPYIDGSDQQFSLSHTDDKVAVILGDKRVGVDIEKESDKILRIQHKFVNEGERSFINEDQLLEGASIVWGAKESMFKIHQEGALSYLNHLQLHPFQDFNSDHFECHIQKNELIACKGFHDRVGAYRLVSVWEL